MTKKTIMEQLTETDIRAKIKGRYYDMNRLFGHAMDDANELHFENIEQHVAVHTLDALERIANALEKDQEEDSGGQTLTYHDFCQSFNEISDEYSSEYYVKPFNGRMVSISNSRGFVVASLYASSRIWNFHESDFNCNELALMTQLAATSPELRGEIDNERIS
ncbi:hypothetical protein ACXO8R_03070 [Lactobacillus delbrueckii subsp. bulgaricus]